MSPRSFGGTETKGKQGAERCAPSPETLVRVSEVGRNVNVSGGLQTSI